MMRSKPPSPLRSTWLILCFIIFSTTKDTVYHFLLHRCHVLKDFHLPSFIINSFSDFFIHQTHVQMPISFFFHCGTNTLHAIYSLTKFYICSIVDTNVVGTTLHSRSLELIRLPRLKLYSCCLVTPRPPHTSPLPPTIPLFDALNLTILDTS